MSLFSGIMAASCMIVVPGASTIDEFGQEIPGSPVETGPHRCYFFQPEGTLINLGSGEHQKTALRVMLPSSVDVSVGYHIRGLSSGYQDTYEITAVEPANHLDVLDHWECDLEKVL